MRILITGAAGFIGSHLTDRFLAEGHEVVGVDNLTTGRRANLPTSFDLREVDISAPVVGHRNYLSAIGPWDLIVHCAASYKDPAKWHQDTQVNVLGTINATIAALDHGCPIIYMQTALPPVSSYAISKTAGMQYIQQSGATAVIFRLANIYGPRNLSGPIPTFYKRLTEGLPCTVVDTTRDMVYIDDLVTGIINAPVTQGEVVTYDMCSGRHSQIADLFVAVDMALGTETTYGLTPPSADEAMTHVSVLNRPPGWSSVTTLNVGIHAAVEWYGENPPEQTFTHLRMEPSHV